MAPSHIDLSSQSAAETVHAVIARYSDMVYRIAYARTGNRLDAEDVYQEVFFRLFAKRPRIESEEHLRAWLIRAACNTSVNLVKSAWRRLVRPMPEGFDPPAEVADDTSASALRGALYRLPEKYRAVLCLYYYEEISTDEIARILGEKPTTIRTRLRRGREKLRILLENGEGKEQ